MSKRRASKAAKPEKEPAAADEMAPVRDTSDGKSGSEQTGARRRFPIVGIGASAGGLEAFTQLLEALPLDTGMGFVLVQHLDPDHESALVQILSRATSLPVAEITNDQVIEPDHVYIIPRNASLSVDGGILRLSARGESRTPHRPIDSFFEALAKDSGERAIGVVLSGTASDGTLGLEAIKADGGITFAQDETAKYDAMPRNAIASGSVDLVLSPVDIARELARIAAHPAVAGGLLAREGDDAEWTSVQPSDAHRESGRRPKKQVRGRKEGEPASEGTAGDAYGRILLLLRNRTGVDFSLYKSTTIQRRIARRLVLSKQPTLDGYARVLQNNARELDALYSDVLISVTSFFRNPEVFEAIQREVLPALLRQRTDEPIRCWVVGCSTGQEAYSLAMVFVEVAERAQHGRPLQIFATDVNEALLEKARQGLYAKSLVEGISPQRLRRFFTDEGGGYRVSKALREMVIFARQNLIADPPFSRMDLVSCRNLLIYLESELQKRAIPTFHYALRPGGFLVLGASESVAGFTELFEPVDKKHKIYTKKPASTPTFHLPLGRPHGEHVREPGGEPSHQRKPVGATGRDRADGLRVDLSPEREADRVAVNQFAPPGVLINADNQVLQFRGPTGAYLEPPTGKASFDGSENGPRRSADAAPLGHQRGDKGEQDREAGGRACPREP